VCIAALFTKTHCIDAKEHNMTQLAPQPAASSENPVVVKAVYF